MNRIPVAVLGATGTVGQKFIRLLADHPWFEIVALAASENSAGRTYGEVVRWREAIPLPPRIAGMVVQRSRPPLEAKVVFSALDADIAQEIEQDFARAGAVVITNTRVHRMDPDVPLLVPEVNADHLDLIDGQRQRLVATQDLVHVGRGRMDHLARRRRAGAQCLGGGRIAIGIGGSRLAADDGAVGADDDGADLARTDRAARVG